MSYWYSELYIHVCRKLLSQKKKRLSHRERLILAKKLNGLRAGEGLSEGEMRYIDAMTHRFPKVDFIPDLKHYKQ